MVETTACRRANKHTHTQPLAKASVRERERERVKLKESMARQDQRDWQAVTESHFSQNHFSTKI